MREDRAEKSACKLSHVQKDHFNASARIPYGLAIEDVCSSMNEFLDFLSFINIKLHSKEMPRLECFLMPANFSSIVGEFMTTTIPKFCTTIVKNTYHNGHPDLLPSEKYRDNSVLHGSAGIEVKASRYMRGWQGHNPEDAWLMVFCFEANRITDKEKGLTPMPFRFVKVVGAKLKKCDWNFSGRSETSRRTITASVTRTGFDKMEANWIYRAPE